MLFRSAQLEELDGFIKVKNRNAGLYSKYLKEVKGLTLPTQKQGVDNVNWLYSVLIEDDFTMTRNELILRLRSQEIESRPFFSPIHRMPPYQNYRSCDLKQTIELSERGINLPSSVSLTESDIENICRIIRS